MSYHSEIVLKVVDRLHENKIILDENELVNILDEVLNEYKIEPKTNALITTDIPEKTYYFLSCKRLEGLSEGTLKNYYYTLKDLSQGLYKPVHLITTVDLRIYVNNKSKNLKPSSLEPIIWTIKSFFAWLQDEEYISKNPAKKLKPPKRDKNVREYLSVEQVEVIRNNCSDPRDRALVEFFLSTGCRVSEIVGLRVKDISDGAIKVKGKGNKERYVYINKKAMMYLKIYLKGRNVESEYIFISQKKPNNYIKSRSIERVINKIGERSEIELYPHLFRHTFASQLLQNGASLKAVQDLLGHEQATTTQVYAKLNDRNIRNEHLQYAVI